MIRYRQSITIQNKVKTPDGYGGTDVTWSDYKTVGCDVVLLSGSEYLRAQQLTDPYDVNIFTDYDRTITSDMRVKFSGKTLNIKDVLPIMPDINGEYTQLNLKCSSY